MNGFCRLCGTYQMLDDTGACNQCARAEHAAVTLPDPHKPKALAVDRLTVAVTGMPAHPMVEIVVDDNPPVRLDTAEWKRLRDLLDTIPPKAV